MVPPSSHGISRAPRYFGYCSSTFVFTYRILTFFDQPSHAVRLTIVVLNAVLNPERIAPLGLASSAFAPTACKHRVSGTLSLPSRGAFHLSLTVLFAIGHQVVFSLGGWSPRLPTGFLVSCGTLDTNLVKHISLTGLLPSPVPVSTAIQLCVLPILSVQNPDPP